MTIHFDANSTSPIHAQALEAMNQAYRRGWGNPSMPHALGDIARGCLEDSRLCIFNALGADPMEWQLHFTTGATEANFLALNAPLAADGNIRGLLLSAVEHSSVLGMRSFAQFVPAEVLPVLSSGTVDLGALVKRVNGGRYLLSLMHANNETGVYMPVKEAARIVKRDKGIVHVDAAQTAGRVDIADVLASADLITFSAHKFGGPIGIGAMLVRHSVKMRAVQPAHTFVNVPAVLGMAVALEENLKKDFQGLGEARGRIESMLRDRFAGKVMGEGPRLANTSCIAFAGVPNKNLLKELSRRGICVGLGEGYSSEGDSHVLGAMGVDPALRQGAIRISLSPANRGEEVEFFLAHFPEAWQAASENIPSAVREIQI